MQYELSKAERLGRMARLSGNAEQADLMNVCRAHVAISYSNKGGQISAHLDLPFSVPI